jgi:hypothetical protein
MKEERTKIRSEKEYLNKIEQDKFKEMENKMQIKMKNKKLLDEQLEQVRLSENLKRINKISNIEEEKKYKEIFQNIMDYKDRERQGIHLNIQEKAKIIDIREKNHINYRNLKELIDNEMEIKYKKEKEQLEKRYFL